MNKGMSLLLSFLISFTLLPWSGFASETAPVKGIVVDSQGDPIANAVVTATDDQGKAAGSATTDAQGRYSMELPIGKKYTLKLDPPEPLEKPTGEVTSPLLAASGAVVNLTIDDTGGKLLVAAGLITIAGSAGAAVGAASSDEKKVSSPSN